MPMPKLNTKYNGVGFLNNNCITHVSNENSHLANLAVDVVMPPSRYQSNNSLPTTPIPEKGNKECNLISKYNSNLVQTQQKVHDSRKKVPKVVLKQLSERISFDENVVEERSPHTIPFSQCNVQKMYEKTHFERKKKKIKPSLLTRNAPEPEVKDSLQSVSKKVDFVNSVEMKDSSESFLLSFDDSPERLKLMARRKSTKQLISSNNNHHKPPAQIWEEYVLSKLSKTTTDLILKDLTHIDKYRNALNQESGNSSLYNHKLEHLKELEKEATQIESKVNVDKIDSSVQYFASIPNNKNLNPEKNVQVAYPYPPSKWLESDHHKNNMDKMGRVTRGMQKWTGYPTFKEEEELILRQISDTNLYDKTVRLPMVVRRKYSYNLVLVVNEWRNKWILDRKYEGKSFADLKSGMKDISEHVRFVAVLAVGSVIMAQQEINADEEEILLDEVTQLLDDDSSTVSLAAALTLFSMNKASAKAKDILMKTVCDGHSPERWVAVQCLAEYRYHDNCIVRELISNITGKEVHKHAKAIDMLKELSHLSLSIQYMVAEKLNSGSWSDRLIACQVLPILDGTLSKDIAGKLSYILWNDWSGNVRKAALEALGKTGNANLVHTTLCKRLLSKNTNKQVTALKMITSLGFMTAHLLSPLLLCLQSNNDEVCLQSIKLCMKMKLNDESIMIALITLLNSDRACKIRIFVLRALGRIGEKSTLIRDNLLWTLHFNKESELRKEACSTIIKLRLCDEEIVNVLQDIVFIDEDASVRQEVVLALYTMGFQAVGNIALAETIEKSIKKLCHKDNVIAHVVEGQKVEKETSTNKEHACTDSSGYSDSSSSDEDQNVQDDDGILK